MGILKKIIGGIVILLVLFVAAGMMMPDHKHFDRSITIDAPREDVFALIGDFHEWSKWSPWQSADPDMELTITGDGAGQIMSWTSTTMGNGKQTILTFEPPRLMETRLDFGDQGGGSSAFILTEEDGQTRVIWTFDTNMREGVPLLMQPMAGWLGLIIEDMVAKDYERGLATLKEAAEG